MSGSLTRRGFLAGAGAVTIGAVAAPGSAARAATTARPSGSARTVILNGSVLTAGGRGAPAADAVAIGRDGRIVAVGRSRDVRRLAGRGTDVIDAAGGSIMAGIHDGHMHPLGAAQQSLNPSLQNATVTVADLQAILTGFLQASATAEPDGWLQVTDWNPVGLLPAGTVATKAYLDALDTQRPIYLQGSDFHNSFVNSRALALAGVTRTTADPVGGEIVRDASGEPTGLLKDTAQDLVRAVIPPPSDAELQQAYADTAAYLLSLGIVAFMDAASAEDSIATYADLQSRGLLLQNVTPAVRLDTDRINDPRGTVDWLAGIRSAYAGLERLHIGTTKVFVDGVIEFPAQTAALLQPYLDADGRPTDNYGDLYVTSGQYGRLAVALDAAGWQMHSHAIGDAAVRVALDAYQAAIAAGGARASARRHTIAHLQLVDPRDIPRFGQLGVYGSMQLQWAVRNVWTLDALRPYIGDQRWHRLYPAASIARAGGQLAGGSDWPVDPIRPFNQIATAIDRSDPDGDTRALGANQELSRAASLRMHTATAARQLHSTDTGEVAVGRRADLVVLDRDLARVPVADIRGTVVRQTLIAGEVVHEASSTAARRAAQVGAATSLVHERLGRSRRAVDHAFCGH